MSNPKRTITIGGAEVQSPDEKFEAIRALTQKIEEQFIELGNILSNIKRSKLYRFKGYEKFKDFVEAEYAFSAALAGKLVRVYESFVEEMDQDEETLKEIGFERLCCILPMIRDEDPKTREQWLKQAQDLPVQDLKTAIKAHRKEAADAAPQDLKAVLVEQFLERMLTWFNCSAKELQFKLALYFQDYQEKDWEQMKKEIKQKQAKFLREVTNADR